jgi:hypothetical protein
VRFYTDGLPLIVVADSEAKGQYVGIWSHRTRIKVSGFKVVACSATECPNI